MQIRFRQEIAVLWDTIYSFRVQYNRERFEKLAEEYEEIRNEVNLVSLIPYTPTDAMAPFFYHLPETAGFLQQFLIKHISGCHGNYDEISVQSFFKALQNYDDVVMQLFLFYFPELEAARAAELLKSPADLVLAVRDQQNCNDTIKNNLLAILLNPAREIQRLSYELVEREQQIKLLYEKKAETLTQLKLQFTEEHIRKCWGEEAKAPTDLSQFDDVTVAFCALSQEILYESLKGSSLLWVLGCEYEKTQFPEDDGANEEMFASCVTALGEKNRRLFFDYIFEHEGVTGKELEKEFDMTGPNVYYHLGALSRAELVKSENKGRNIHYYVDRDTIRKMRHYLERYEG